MNTVLIIPSMPALKIANTLIVVVGYAVQESARNIAPEGLLVFLVNKLWHKESPEGAELETTELLSALVRHKKPKWVIETGTAHGQTAEAMGRALRDNGIGQLWSCDIDADRCSAARVRCEGLPVEIFQQSGADLIRAITEAEPERYWDMAFIDSWWQPVRIEEVQLITSRISQGGLLCLHDVNQNYGHVYREAQKTGWQNIIMLAPYGLAIFQAPGFDETIGMGKMVDFEPIAPTI